MRATQMQWLVVSGALLLAACPGTTVPGRDGAADTSGPPDGATITPGDDDGDGLCNRIEALRGTDPMDQDTDGDGLSDFVEDAFDFDPLVASIPSRDIIFRLLEEPGAMVRAETAFVLDGAGADYAGGFEAEEAFDARGLLASDFFTGTVALVADPPDNVTAVEREAATFRGVVGRTELTFESTFVFEGSDRFEPCLRAFPFQYQIKRNDSVLTTSERYLLVVAPPTSDGTWCTPAPATPCD